VIIRHVVGQKLAQIKENDLLTSVYITSLVLIYNVHMFTIPLQQYIHIHIFALLPVMSLTQ